MITIRNKARRVQYCDRVRSVINRPAGEGAEKFICNVTAASVFDMTKTLNTGEVSYGAKDATACPHSCFQFRTHLPKRSLPCAFFMHFSVGKIRRIDFTTIQFNLVTVCTWLQFSAQTQCNFLYLICSIRMETQTTSNREVRSEMLSQDDKSNLLILLSSDRTIPINPVCVHVLQEVFIEFSEVNVSATRPSSEPLISCSQFCSVILGMHAWNYRHRYTLCA